MYAKLARYLFFLARDISVFIPYSKIVCGPRGIKEDGLSKEETMPHRSQSDHHKSTENKTNIQVSKLFQKLKLITQQQPIV